MTDNFRVELREAFEREQAGLGDVSGIGRRLVRTAMGARAGSLMPNREVVRRRAQWAAGVAAVVLAAIVITSFALFRAGAHSHPVPAATPTPTAHATPTPLSRELIVPDSTPVILYHDPATFAQIDGTTWDGKSSGKVSGAPGTSIGTNPGASLFATATQIRDRHGKVVATGTFGAKYFGGTWADDNFHFCQMVPFDYLGANGVPATLQVGSPGGPPRSVAKVGKVYEQSFIGVAACSVEADRAVVVQSGGQGVGTAQYWVVQLSTGKTLWTHNFQETTGVPIQVVSSRDGNYVAESQAVITGTQTSWTASVFGPAGSQVAQLPGSVAGFSWDGSRAVLDPGNGRGSVKIVRVSDGGIIWSGPAGLGVYPWQVAAEPGGGSLAIGITDPAHPAQPTDPTTAGLTPVDLYVIAPDGKVVIQMNGIYW